MPVHAARKQRGQQHEVSTETALHEIESISVALLSTSESLAASRFQVTVVMKSTPERLPAVTGMQVPGLVHRSEKQLEDFESLHKAFSRAVVVTHLFSRCTFCKTIQSHSIAGKGTGEGQDNFHLSLEQFMNNILDLLVPLRNPSDKRICYGKMQCWHLLTKFLLSQTETE
ncbi:hypothetical protein P3T76_012554 [Phytophthora citrophthora]|uniref:Uncharacterized protein n=1 Tax=Phytophthora citrophthora TaxID=4793 RepID=A0AAD9G4N6_9STRA|nr:hypothetical protein P3T76_012554 [Phytophthora citrophthora]